MGGEPPQAIGQDICCDPLIHPRNALQVRVPCSIMSRMISSDQRSPSISTEAFSGHPDRRFEATSFGPSLHGLFDLYLHFASYMWNSVRDVMHMEEPQPAEVPTATIPYVLVGMTDATLSWNGRIIRAGSS
jgi:hypothetical protein